MIWHILRYLLSLSIPAFYRKITVKNAHYVPREHPAILSFNHPNAFTDPLGITFGIWPVRTWYMARGDVFRPGVISAILENIGIVPIFRLRDGGKEGLMKNDESYRRVFRLLKKGKKVIVFSEGLCIQERRLRPIKKGVPRMVFAAWEEVNNPDLTLIPVGLFYERPNRFGSDWLFNIGEPIPIKPWYDQYLAEPAKTLFRFQQFIEAEMKKLVIHINHKEFDILAEQLEKIYFNEFLYKKKVRPDPYERFLLAKIITDHLNSLSPENPQVGDLIKQFQIFFDFCRTHHIRPWMMDDYFFKNLNFTDYLRIALLLFVLPLFILGSILLYIPNRLTFLTTNFIVRSVEFYSSFLIGSGTFILLFYFLMISFLLSLWQSSARYPVFIPAFLCLLFISGFWYKNYISYKKIFSYIWRGRNSKIKKGKKMLLDCKEKWESLTNFKL
ncbi:MAG: 1-acyl-sn-glycerol-3-phosphate acyltransferase [Bacteroidia bacterium]|nr:1-acyl-sn-glycerol-3-phosphate acyltransferase [Bacteroidia bacterium]